jgi:hypothetical protein
MLLVPKNLSSNYIAGNMLATRIVGTFGTSITPGTSNSYGSYTSILAGSGITQDCYGILLTFTSAGSGATTSTKIATLGIDPAGGTSYQTLIPDLACSNPTPFNRGAAGYWYYFPLRVPAGAQLAIKGANSGTTGTLAFRASIWLFGQPSNEENLRFGSFVQAIGVSGTTGVSLTPGTTSEGAWVSLGTTSKNLWGWQPGMCIASAPIGQVSLFDFAVGDASNKRIIIQDAHFMSDGTYANSHSLTPFAFAEVAAGSTIYARAQTSDTNVSNFSAMIYGVGG